jgi:hypothetical protein
MHPIIRGLTLSALVCGTMPFGAVAAQATARSTTAVVPVVPSVDLASPSTLAPFRAGDRFFSLDASGALQVREGENGQPRALLPAGTFSIVAPSPDGRYVAYTVGPSHVGPYDVRIRDVQTGRDLADVLHLARISPAAWSHDNKGFLYVREESTGGRQRVYYHGLGRAADKDALILSQFDHPEWRYAARVSDDGNYAVFTISYPADAHTRIYFIDLANPGKPNFGAPVVKLTQSFDARYEFVDNAAGYFFLQTDRDAPRGRILLANTDVIRETRWPSLIPQTDDSLLFARTAGDEYLVAVYRTASGADVAKLFGPEDPNVLRQEIHNRIDSLKKAREKEDDKRPVREIGSRGFMGNGPAIRLASRSDIPIPAGATIVAMNSLADKKQLFYTLKLSDGTMQSFVFDVDKARNEPYPPSPSTRK